MISVLGGHFNRVLHLLFEESKGGLLQLLCPPLKKTRAEDPQTVVFTETAGALPGFRSFFYSLGIGQI